jgi:hypothetical protein
VKSWAVRTLGELGSNVTLAPERYRNVASEARGVLLSELAVEVRRRVRAGERAIILDTTHVKEGVVELPRAGTGSTRGAKTRVPVGAVLISRLRPYLRQVALVSPSLFSGRDALALACSTEFSVLVARDEGESLAFLLPFLLSAEVQARLAAGQEGGHRPRVPRETLMALRIPHAAVRQRRKTSAAIEEALGRLYAARSRWTEALG